MKNRILFWNAELMEKVRSGEVVLPVGTRLLCSVASDKYPLWDKWVARGHVDERFVDKEDVSYFVKAHIDRGTWRGGEYLADHVSMTVHVAHWSGSRKATLERFNTLCAANGLEPVYPMRSFEPGDTLKIDSNQAMRDATVIAVDEKRARALIEYVMPKGSTSLLEISIYADTWISLEARGDLMDSKRKNVSYTNIPQRWGKIIVAETLAGRFSLDSIIGNSNGRYGYYTFTIEDGNLDAEWFNPWDNGKTGRQCQDVRMERAGLI